MITTRINLTKASHSIFVVNYVLSVLVENITCLIKATSLDCLLE